MTALRTENNTPLRMDIPYRMYFSEVCAVARLSKSELNKRIRNNQFPAHIDRGREKIFSGEEVYMALGMIAKQESLSAEDRLLKALEN